MALVIALQSLITKLTNIKLHHLDAEKPSDFLGSSVSEYELLKTGNDLFRQFFSLGCQASQENIISLKNINDDEISSLACSVSNLIVDNERWLYRYLFAYPGFCINIDIDEFIDEDVCQIRSGVQYMLDLFKETGNEKLNDVLKNLEEELVVDFDSKIKLAKECIEFCVTEEDIPSSIPKTHFWWF